MSPRFIAQKARGIMEEDTACQWVSLRGAGIMELSDSWAVGLPLPFAVGVALVQSFVPFPGTLRIQSCVGTPDPPSKWCLRALPPTPSQWAHRQPAWPLGLERSQGG